MEKIMQRVIIVSDSHGKAELLKRIYEYEREAFPGEMLFLHAGDSCAKSKEELYNFISVKGNMDYLDSLPFYRVISLYEHKALMSHGHFYQGSQIKALMDENNCDICISGHTHILSVQKIDGKYFLNPGSVFKPRFMSKKGYLVLDIFEDGNIKIETKLIEEIL